MWERENLLSDVKSERAKINVYYTARGQQALEDENGKHPFDGEFSFIIAVGDDLEIKAYKRTILHELGRLEDKELIREVACVICEHKLSTAKAIVYIRQFRSKQKKGDKLQLANEIINKLNDYNIKHSDVDYFLMLEALDIVKNSIMEKFSENN